MTEAASKALELIGSAVLATDGDTDLNRHILKEFGEVNVEVLIELLGFASSLVKAVAKAAETTPSEILQSMASGI